MRPSKIAVRQWCLALVSTASLIAGAVALQSCGGEGGAIGNGGAGGGGNTGIAAAFKALQPAAQQDATYVGTQKCAECHSSSASIAAGGIYEHWQGTAHANANVGCENCHGPGSAHVAGPSTDNILTFPKSTNAIVCAQCHGKIYDDWNSSAHAQLIPDPVAEAGANPAVYGRASRCIQCHSGLMRTHVEEGEDLGTMSDARIQEISEQTYNEADPTNSDVPFTASCVTCHNPHSTTGNLDVDGAEVQLRHPVTQTDVTKILPVTTPNTADQWVSFDHICGECHNGRGADGTDTRLSQASSGSRPNMHDSPQFNMLMGVKDSGSEYPTAPIVRNMAHADIPGQCVKCHMPDGKHTFVVDLATSCQPCHTADGAAARIASARGEILSQMAVVKSRLESWALTTFGDKNLWDYTALLPAGTTAPPITSIPMEIRRARHNLYYVIRDGSYGPHNAPYSLYLMERANANLDTLGVPPVAAPAAATGRTANTLLQEFKQMGARAATASIETTQ